MMKRIVFTFCAFAILMPVAHAQEVVWPWLRLSDTWKFAIGDNIEWSRPQFNDGQWADLKTTDFWELDMTKEAAADHKAGIKHTPQFTSVFTSVAEPAPAESDFAEPAFAELDLETLPEAAIADPKVPAAAAPGAEAQPVSAVADLEAPATAEPAPRSMFAADVSFGGAETTAPAEPVAGNSPADDIMASVRELEKRVLADLDLDLDDLLNK